jgi:predicted PurR-regulated permease PerM
MPEAANTSPKWNPTTKLMIGLTSIAIFIALLVTFRNIIGPLILAFILAYLIYPVAHTISKQFRISWRLTINIIYILLLIIVIASFTATGLAIFQQLQSLISFIQRSVTNLPSLVEELSAQVFHFGPFEFSLAQYDLQSLIDQILSWIQPILGKAGGLISSMATGAATTIAWGLFVLVISYFLLSDTDRVSHELVHIDLPGYDSDVRRLGAELQKIWNAFLRGQFVIIFLVMIVYSILMIILGMRFALGIAILAVLARFVPYIGPAVLWVVTFLVAYFQGGNYFGFPPITYAIIVVAAAFLTDQVFDNLVSPRLFGRRLGVHPAAVLVTAIIAARLIGLIGLILAAPALATLKLGSSYVIHKMFDLNPWSESTYHVDEMEMPWKQFVTKIKEWTKKWRSRKNKQV